MPRKLRELRADLRRAGFFLRRTRGSHTIWKHPLLPGSGPVLAGKDSADAKQYQEDEVRRALEAARETEGRQQP